MLTYHGVPTAVWAEQEHASAYLPEAFAQDGFIHTTATAAGLAAALSRHYIDDARPYLAVLIDLDRCHAAWDIARYPDFPDEFPHIYCSLNRDAVVEVIPLVRQRGAFLPPSVPR